VRPPGSYAESAKAAELADENKDNALMTSLPQVPLSMPFSFPLQHYLSYQFRFLVYFAYFPVLSRVLCRPDAGVDKNQPNKERKARPKDVFGRALPTEHEFEVLKKCTKVFFWLYLPF
jgi:hypothetical protein